MIPTLPLPKLLVLLLPCFLLPSSLSAQGLDLPSKSPAAHLSATIGYTVISVGYSAPAVSGREVWGELVPYDAVWRAGANEATTVCFSTAVRMMDRDVEAGCYALLVLPKKDAPWTVILNRDTSLRGTTGYNKNLDALRMPVEAKFARTASQERLQYTVTSQSIESGYLLLSWERLRLYLPIQVNTLYRVKAALQETLAITPIEQHWKVYREAADFLLWAALPRPALEYALKSTEQYPNAKAQWIAARAYAALGQYANALTEAENVRQDSGEESYYTERKKQIEEEVSNWTTKN